MRGRFITFEGVEGSGKSTNIAWTLEYLTAKGIDVTLTHEPGRTKVGEELRHVLLRTRDERLASMTELFMMFASRTQLLDEVIHPALASGTWVLCDRYIDSSVAYQGGGRELGVERVWSLIDSMGSLYVEPDLTILLDIPSCSIGDRMAGRQLDRFEREELSFFERVRRTYLSEAEKSPRMKVIDGMQTVESVQADIRRLLEPFVSDSG